MDIVICPTSQPCETETSWRGKRTPPDCSNVRCRQDWISSEAREQFHNPTHVISNFPSRPHLLRQSIWQQTTPHTTSQNLISYTRNLTLGPLHSQDPNTCVIIRIAHWSTVAPWETKRVDFSQYPMSDSSFHFFVQPKADVPFDLTFSFSQFLMVFCNFRIADPNPRALAFVQQRMPCNTLIRLQDIAMLLDDLHL